MIDLNPGAAVDSFSEFCVCALAFSPCPEPFEKAIAKTLQRKAMSLHRLRRRMQSVTERRLSTQRERDRPRRAFVFSQASSTVREVR